MDTTRSPDDAPHGTPSSDTASASPVMADEAGTRRRERDPARRRRRRRNVALVLVVLIATAAYALRDPSPVGYWRTAAGAAAYEAAYGEAMAAMPTPDETRDVRVDAGVVRVYVWTGTDPGATPLLLLPGRTSGVPMWSENLPGLLGERTVYALDALGDAGMSIQTRAIRDGGDQAAWIEQVLDALGLDVLHLVGHSFGGWLAASYAAHHPERVASLSLLDPVYVVSPVPVSMILRSLPASLPFLPASWRERILEDIGGTTDLDDDDPVAAMIDAGMEHYRVALPAPELIEGEELSGVPTYLALAQHSVMHDAEETAALAEQTMPEATVEVWPGTTHSLPTKVADEIDAAVLEFAAAHDDAR